MKDDVRDSIPLVLLPGLDGTGLMFRPLVRALPSSLRAVVMEYPDEPALSYEQLLPFVLDDARGRVRRIRLATLAASTASRSSRARDRTIR